MWDFIIGVSLFVLVEGAPLTLATVEEWAGTFQGSYGQVRRVRIPVLSRHEKYAQELNKYYSLARRVVQPPLLPADIQLHADFVT